MLLKRPTQLAGAHVRQRAAGVVNGNVLYVSGKHDPVLENSITYKDGVAPGNPVLYQYYFDDQLWSGHRLPDSPAVGHGSLLATHGNQLIMHGAPLFLPSYNQNCSQASVVSKIQCYSSRIISFRT